MRRFVIAIAVTHMLVAAPASAQFDEHAASAPAGANFWLPGSPGQFAFSLRYQPVEWAGLRAGTASVAAKDLVTGPDAPFVVAPTRVAMFLATGGMQWSPSDWIALRATVPFQNQAMTNINSFGNSFRTFAKGIGDVELAALVGIRQRAPYAATLQLGIGLPTGAVNRTHTFPNPDGTLPQLPYSMQPGAGVVSFRPAAALSGRLGSGSWGMRSTATLYAGTNERGWSPGDRLGFSAWATAAVAEEVHLSLRGDAQRWGNVRGRDTAPSLEAAIMPNARPELQGGDRLDMAAGVHWFASKANGLRFAVEYIVPIHQALNGPQLARDWSVIFAVDVLGRR